MRLLELVRLEQKETARQPKTTEWAQKWRLEMRSSGPEEAATAEVQTKAFPEKLAGLARVRVGETANPKSEPKPISDSEPKSVSDSGPPGLASLRF